MKVTTIMFRAVSFVALFGLGVSIGCSGGKTEMATITGIIINIDTLVPSGNMKVWLLDHEDIVTTTPSDEDGVFELLVPVGSRFALVTDDWESGSDIYIPYINVSPEFLTIDGDMEVVVHSCPTPAHPGYPDDSGNWGTVAMINEMLRRTDGEIYSATEVIESSGVLMPFFNLICEGDCSYPDGEWWWGIQGIELTSMTPESFSNIRYFDDLAVNDDGAGWNTYWMPENGDIFCDGENDNTNQYDLGVYWCVGPDVTGMSGMLLAIGDPDDSFEEITMTFEDTNPDEMYGAMSGHASRPWDIPEMTFPVRPGMLTLVLIGCDRNTARCDRDVIAVAEARGLI